MFYHTELEKQKLRLLIKRGEVLLGGNKRLKIYGMLSCKSGKGMKKENRVFFNSEKEAVEKGYRACGHCMLEKYRNMPDKAIINKV
jgi:methylphosphotriester-DNA--protein-cysteine methyltransferase